MRFLLFNLAVVAALFYLFSADRNGAEPGSDHREDPLQAVREQLESLARDVADGRRSTDQTAPQSVPAEMPEAVAQAPRTEGVEPLGEEPRDPSLAPATSSAEAATAQAAQAPGDDPRPGSAVADPIGPLPPLDDPAVARRRAEVLDGTAVVDDAPGEAAVEDGPPMSPEERLRKLYSLAEEMELLYVNKMTR